MNTPGDPDLRVDLVFRGQVIAGFDPEQVKRALGEFFKLDEARRERMFSGVPQVIKRGVTPGEATRAIERFAKLGARVQLQGAATGDVAKPPAPATTSAASPARPAAAPARAPMPMPDRQAPVDIRMQRVPSAPVATAPGGLALLPVDEPPAPPPAPVAPARTAPRARSREPESELPVTPMVVVAEPPSVFGLGLTGRLARRPYAAAALFGWAVMRWGLTGLLHHPRPAMIFLIGLGMLAAAVWTFRLTVLRLHDIGLSGWLVLVGAVPLVGTLAGLLLSIIPGSQSDNRYGAVPDPGNPVLRIVVAVAVACIGAGFRHGLLPDDGSFGGRTAAGSQQVATADDAAQAPTDDELAAFLKSPRARQDFREGYWPAKGHKAFASSESGASGWSSDAGSADAAKAQALAKCETARDAYSAECKTLSVDGEWAD